MDFLCKHFQIKIHVQQFPHLLSLVNGLVVVEYGHAEWGIH